jgi:hypothetical protein
MTGRTSFSTLRSRMSPEAQDRARAKSEALETDDPSVPPEGSQGEGNLPLNTEQQQCPSDTLD